MARIDDAVRRILRVKFRAGLFDHPFVDQAKAVDPGSFVSKALLEPVLRKGVERNQGISAYARSQKTHGIIVRPVATRTRAWIGHSGRFKELAWTQTNGRYVIWSRFGIGQPLRGRSGPSLL